ncbi:hypothetical protein SH2C18_47000 [Clostridium sediminicola]|uniref:hypothetical protein n=1 Tax=Clostridium sediminicola TaxID=3114879 RepID=UPI0031F215C4
MNNKKDYKDAFENIKPSDEIVKKTSQMMKEELHGKKSGRARNFHSYKAGLALVTFGFVLILGFIGVFDFLQNDKSPISQQPEVALNEKGDEVKETEILDRDKNQLISNNESIIDNEPTKDHEEIVTKNSQDNEIESSIPEKNEEDIKEALPENIDERRPMAKVAVNISGEITEISEDGSKIKVGEQWIIINEDTVFEDDPDNGREPVSKEFKVGNRIAGFTLDDVNASEVTAYAIYSNGKF